MEEREDIMKRMRRIGEGKKRKESRRRGRRKMRIVKRIRRIGEREEEEVKEEKGETESYMHSLL